MDPTELYAKLASCPRALRMHFVGTGKYLGFFIGPARGERSWDGPLAKFCEEWDNVLSILAPGPN